MKNAKLIDLLPTLFGLIAIMGAFNQGLWSDTNLGPMMLYGGGAVALITSLISIVNAKRRKHSLSKIHILSIFWLLLAALYLSTALVGLSNPLRFTF
jgi:hypothetical protein